MRDCPLSARKRSTGAKSFTLVELLTVMLIISILAALSLAAGTALWQKGARSRAAAEIQAISSALDSYKADNGVYPQVSLLLTNTYTASDGSVSGGNYQQASQELYESLTSKYDYADQSLSTVAPATGKSYMDFKLNQLGNNSAGAGTTGSGATYIHDPWNYAYGYSSGSAAGAGTASYPYTGQNQFDVWTTGGILVGKLSSNPALTNAWITNWQ